jgi:hypothetical protein
MTRYIKFPTDRDDIHLLAHMNWIVTGEKLTPSSEAVGALFLTEGVNGLRPYAGVIFDGSRTVDGQLVDCQLTITGIEENWVSSAVNYWMTYIAFGILKAARITCTVVPTNTASLRLIEAFGFKKEGRLRKAFDGKKDLLVYGLLPKEATWFKDDRKAARGLREARRLELISTYEGSKEWLKDD